MNVNINALDEMDSLLWASNSSTSRGFSYSPFGSTVARNDGDGLLPGFNGERPDPVSQSYNLGNGYRTYNPTLMRFNAPDSWSPFGAGGLNQYAYCEGDPINRSDPSGHMSSGAAMGIGIGLGILGLLGAVFTFGQSIAAAAAAEAALTASMAADLLATGLGVAASVTNIASTATRESDPEASRVLGWVSFGLGIASFVTHTANSIESKFKGRSGSYDLLSDGDTATAANTSEATGHGIANTTALGSGAYMFEDRYRGRRRFNIRAHGRRHENGVSKLWINEKFFNESELIEFLGEKNIDLRKYGNIHIISCFSADANDGVNSFAQNISNLTGRRVKAYKGVVFSDEKTSLDKFSKNGGDKKFEIFFNIKNTPVTKCNIFEFGSDKRRFFNYQPTHFKPLI